MTESTMPARITPPTSRYGLGHHSVVDNGEFSVPLNKASEIAAEFPGGNLFMLVLYTGRSSYEFAGRVYATLEFRQSWAVANSAGDVFEYDARGEMRAAYPASVVIRGYGQTPPDPVP